MKRNLFLSIVAFGMIAAMMFISCSEKKVPQNIEVPIDGTDYILVTTPDSAKGVRQGDFFVVGPSILYKDISVKEGMFLAKTAKTIYLLDENGEAKISADTINFLKDAAPALFEGRRRGNYVVYIPSWKAHLVAQAYVVKGDYAVYSFNSEITICKEGKKIIKPVSTFAKVAVLPDGSLVVLKGRNWLYATIKNGVIVPGRAVKPKDIKRYRAMKGWDEKSPVMILE